MLGPAGLSTNVHEEEVVRQIKAEVAKVHEVGEYPPKLAILKHGFPRKVELDRSDEFTLLYATSMSHRIHCYVVKRSRILLTIAIPTATQANAQVRVMGGISRIHDSMPGIRISACWRCLCSSGRSRSGRSMVPYTGDVEQPMTLRRWWRECSGLIFDPSNAILT